MNNKTRTIISLKVFKSNDNRPLHIRDQRPGRFGGVMGFLTFS